METRRRAGRSEELLFERERKGVRTLTIVRGSFVLISPFAAGHDPAVFPEPQRFDPRRDSRGLLTFGQGAHYCLGVHLAKSQIGALLDFFLDHAPSGAELDTDGIEWSPQNMFLREITSMPARLR